MFVDIIDLLPFNFMKAEPDLVADIKWTSIADTVYGN